MCPLSRFGTRGLDPDFVRAVRKVVRLIAHDPEGEAFFGKVGGAGGGVRGALEPSGSAGRWLCFAGGIWMKKRFLVCLLAALCCLFAVRRRRTACAYVVKLQRLGVPARHAVHEGGAARAGAAGAEVTELRPCRERLHRLLLSGADGLHPLPVSGKERRAGSGPTTAWPKTGSWGTCAWSSNTARPGATSCARHGLRLWRRAPLAEGTCLWAAHGAGAGGGLFRRHAGAAAGDALRLRRRCSWPSTRQRRGGLGAWAANR